MFSTLRGREFLPSSSGGAVVGTYAKIRHLGSRSNNEPARAQNFSRRPRLTIVVLRAAWKLLAKDGMYPDSPCYSVAEQRDGIAMDGEAPNP